MGRAVESRRVTTVYLTSSYVAALFFYVSLKYLLFQANGFTFCSGEGTAVDDSAALGAHLALVP